MESKQTIITNLDVSVIVPVYNSGEDITRTINALVCQDYDKSRYEIIIVDNGSTDNTPKVIKDYCEKYPSFVKLFFQNEIQSSYAARNTGIKHANGDIFAFVDADMWMDKSWLCLVVNKMRSMNVDYMGCRVDIQDIRNTNNLAALYNRLRGFAVDQDIALYHFAPTCCLVTKASLFKKVGVFDDSVISSGDWEFGNRVFQQGIKLHYAPDIWLYHPARNTLQSLKKKYIRIGKGEYQMFQRYSTLPTYKQRSLFRRLLPPNPISFVKKFISRSKDRDVQISSIQIFALYFVHCYVKWANSVGYIMGQVSNRFG